MKYGITIGFIAAFFFGFIVRQLLPIKQSIKSHWEAVHEYNEYIRNPSDFESHSNGLISFSEPFAIGPHLAYLVEKGELIHLDLLLPETTRSRETTKYWMKFCEPHYKDIVHAISYDEGKAPVHVNLWYKPSAQPLIDQLIHDLKSLGTQNKAKAE